METFTVEAAKGLGYGEYNHIHKSWQSLADSLEVGYNPDFTGPTKTSQFNITKWLDLLIETDSRLWIPAVELFALLTLPIKEIVRVGYINGTHHHLGFAAKGMSSSEAIKGYTLWVEYN